MALHSDKWIGDFHPREGKPGGVPFVADGAKADNPYYGQWLDQNAIDAEGSNGPTLFGQTHPRQFWNGEDGGGRHWWLRITDCRRN